MPSYHFSGASLYLCRLVSTHRLSHLCNSKLKRFAPLFTTTSYLKKLNYDNITCHIGPVRWFHYCASLFRYFLTYQLPFPSDVYDKVLISHRVAVSI
ncbi:unnamed protein product [Amoebophrya sp. A25]|nr:unnamed protein product [Amoebophrya sp. A25]|eukprot:GSA25T00001183001.1